MAQEIVVGSILEGKIVKIKPFGAIVAIADGAQGLVHISQISDKFVQDINDVVAIGDTVRVKVLSKDEENGKITLSIKAAGSETGASGGSENTEAKRDDDGRDFRRKYSDLSFDEKLKDWIKQSNERQAGINKRNNRR